MHSVFMDYRARGSWIGNVRGRLGKAGYGGSDVTCILVCISSVMRMRAPTAIYQASLVPRPSTPPVFDRLQYAKTEGEGLGNFIT